MRDMKDSGVAWLGEIPSHWEVVYPKALFRLRKEKAKPGDRQLTASQQYGVIYQEDYMALTGSRVVAVSYTHLDVYKRQRMASPVGIPMLAPCERERLAFCQE